MAPKLCLSICGNGVIYPEIALSKAHGSQWIYLPITTFYPAPIISFRVYTFFCLMYYSSAFVCPLSPWTPPSEPRLGTEVFRMRGVLDNTVSSNFEHRHPSQLTVPNILRVGRCSTIILQILKITHSQLERLGSEEPPSCLARPSGLQFPIEQPPVVGTWQPSCVGASRVASSSPQVRQAPC